MRIRQYRVEVGPTASGAASKTTDFRGGITGLLRMVRYEKASSDSYADGVDFDIQTTKTAQEVWDEDDVNASKNHNVRVPLVDGTGTALTYTNDADPLVDKMVLLADQFTITIASGGNGKTGAFIFVVEENDDT